MSPVGNSAPQGGRSRASGRAVSSGMSDVRLYNSLTKKVEALKPLKAGHIGLYTCGPTVYDYAHIGNLRTYIFEDTLRRVLRLNGYKVKHVMNITDIEDKIFTRAKELGIPPSDLTQQYEEIFFQDVKNVGIDLEGSRIIRATEAIGDMHALIKKIPNKYVAQDGIYFDISKYEHYGAFGHLDRSHVHHRINNDEYDKDHVADFALWKTKKPGELSWDFEVDGQNLEGRPGWHIECSAMSTKYLGQPFDIHTGGVDLKFPHHENEIAQAKAATGTDLANVFMHAEHLLVGGKKMSKSLNNFYTLRDIEEKKIEPLAFRLLVLQTHYRSQLNLTWQSLTAAQSFLQKALRPLADLAWQSFAKGSDLPGRESLPSSMLTVASDDLHTTEAISQLAKLADTNLVLSSEGQTQLQAVLRAADALLGLQLSERRDITGAERTLIAQREEHKSAGDYDKADELRQTLLDQHQLGLKDGAKGTSWFRTDS